MERQAHGPYLVHPRLLPTPSIRLYTWVAATAFNLATGIAYAASFPLAQWLSPSDGLIAAFDLDGEGSLNAWLSTVSLFMLAMFCLAALLVRRLKSAGRRELACWGWAATVFAVMSLDEGGSLHEGFKELCARLFGTRLYGDGSVYWAVPYAVVLAVALAGLHRYLIVPRRWPRLALYAGAGCFLLAALAQLELFWPTEDVAEIVLEELLEVQGTLLLLAGVAAFVFEQASLSGIPARTAGTATAQSRLVVVRVGRPPAHTSACPLPNRSTGARRRSRAA